MISIHELRKAVNRVGLRPPLDRPDRGSVEWREPWTIVAAVPANVDRDIKMAHYVMIGVGVLLRTEFVEDLLGPLQRILASRPDGPLEGDAAATASIHHTLDRIRKLSAGAPTDNKPSP